MLARDFGSVFDPGGDLPYETFLVGTVVTGLAANWYFQERGWVTRIFGYGAAGVGACALGAWTTGSKFFVGCIATSLVSMWMVGNAILGPTFVASEVVKHVPAYVRAWKHAEAVNEVIVARLEQATDALDARYAALDALKERLRAHLRQGDALARPL